LSHQSKPSLRFDRTTPTAVPQASASSGSGRRASRHGNVDARRNIAYSLILDWAIVTIVGVALLWWWVR
jgi:hypothetical protein